MTTQSEELLDKIQELKAVAKVYTAAMQDATTRKLLIESHLSDLTDKLSEVAGTVDWAKIGKAVDKAATEAQEAVQKLADALDEAEVSYE